MYPDLLGEAGFQILAFARFLAQLLQLVFSARLPRKAGPAVARGSAEESLRR